MWPRAGLLAEGTLSTDIGVMVQGAMDVLEVLVGVSCGRSLEGIITRHTQGVQYIMVELTHSMNDSSMGSAILANDELLLLMREQIRERREEKRERGEGGRVCMYKGERNEKEEI